MTARGIRLHHIIIILYSTYISQLDLDVILSSVQCVLCTIWPRQLYTNRFTFDSHFCIIIRHILLYLYAPSTKRKKIIVCTGGRSFNRYSLYILPAGKKTREIVIISTTAVYTLHMCSNPWPIVLSLVVLKQ